MYHDAECLTSTRHLKKTKQSPGKYLKHVTSQPIKSAETDAQMAFSLLSMACERRDQGTEATWRDQSFLGPSQWDRLTQAFEVDFAECDLVLFGAPTPLVFLSQK